MDADGIRQVIREVFGNIKTEEINGWISLPCQLATWTHAKGRDTRASSGISIKPNGVSVHNCFTCGNKMPFHGMLRKYANYSGENLDDLIEEIEEEAYVGPREMPGWDDPRAAADTELVPLKKSVYLDLYAPAAGHPYLKARGISDATANLLGLMVDPCDPADGFERILFPVFGPEGELYGLSGRDVTGEAKLKVRDYFGLRKAACVLGSHLVAHSKHDKVLVVEGLFDYANCWQQGYPGVAVMHSSMTERQAAILRDIGKPTYLFYDDDEAGDKGIAQAGKALWRYQPTMKVCYPEIWIDNPKEPEGGHYVKDPGELLAEEFDEMLRGAFLYSPK